MKRRMIKLLVIAVALGSIAAGATAVASGDKLPKCAAVKCRSLGCPADVLCVSGSSVKTCADVCNGH